LPANEAERLQVLERYQILDTAPETAFDDLTQLAAQICQTPMALVSFVDANRAWSKSLAGWELSETPRDLSFSGHAILNSEVMVVADTALDKRFSDNPIVTKPPGIRFFAGAPLITPQGFALGTLAVIDRTPRQLTDAQLNALRRLARQAMDQLESRLHLSQLEREVSNHQRTEEALRQAEEMYRSIFENAREGIFQTTPDGHYLSANLMLAKIYGFATVEDLIASLGDISKQLYVDPTRRAEFARLMEKHEAITKFESQIYRQDGSVIWISENARTVRDGKGRLLYYEGTVEDITEQKRAEEAIHHSEIRFRSVWQNSADGMRLTDGEGIIRAVNPAFCKLVGLAATELEGRPFTVIYAATENHEQMLAKYRQRYAARNIDSHLERQLTFRDGQTADIELSNSLVDLGKTDPLVLTIYHDITRRKRMEKALRDSELLYHSLVENLPQNIFRKDQQERFTFGNSRFCQTLGRSLEEIVGRTDFDFFPPDLAAKYQRDDQRIMETRQIFEGVEALQAPDHGKVYVQVVKTPLFDVHGNVSGVQGIFWDVTERKKTEEQLAFERELLRALLDNAPDRIFFKDTESRFLRCSLAMAQRLGLKDPDEVIGKTDFDFHPEDRAREFFADEQTLLLTGQPLINKIEQQTDTGGGRIWASVTKVPTRNRSGAITGLIGISRDITALKHAEAELALARDAALESARLKSEFLATVSHEIRTPMNAIIGMTGILLETELTEEQKDFALTVQTSADALLSIINDILDFSKIEAGRLTFEHIDFDLRDVVEGVMELQAHRAQTKGIELVSHIPTDVMTRLRGDPGRIRQVLVNLVGNSVKFTERGEVIVEVSRQSETAAQVTLLCEVRDTGIGIAPEAQGKIFQAFTQADGSTTRKYGGTGLGLSISKQLVELMSGEVGVRSEPAKGSTFWFTMKLEKQPDRTTATSVEAENLMGCRVLIVDDNATNRKILQYQTAAWRMSHGSAASGEEALQMLRDAAAAGKPFELVILDMQMPEMDGLMLAQLIKADPVIAATRLVMLTSLGHRLEPEVLRTAGITVCLFKPIKQSRLFDCLSTVMAGEIPAMLPGPGNLVGGIRAARSETVVPENLRLLLAEDNSVNRKVALLQLKKLGYGAAVAADGVEVLEALERVPYDVILMDCQMPRLDGYATAREIRRREQAVWQSRPPVHIIAMTANALQGDREQCLAAGMNDYMGKPVQVPELAAALSRAGESLPIRAEAAPAADAPLPVTLHPGIIASLRELREPGQPDPVSELIDLFLEDAPVRLKKMEHGLGQSDAPAVYSGAHSLKGSANNLGALRLGALCAKMERQARAQDLTDGTEMLAGIRAEFAIVKKELTAEKLI